MPYPVFGPAPPQVAPDGTPFSDPIWQRWFANLGSSVVGLLKQALSKTDGGTILGAVTINNNLTVSQTVTCQTLVQTSDERLKHRWRRLRPDFVEQLAFLKKSNRAGTFGWRVGGVRAAGVGAQSVARFAPSVVHEGEDGLQRVDYGVLGVLSAVELAERLLKAEERIRLLEERIGQSEWREGRR